MRLSFPKSFSYSPHPVALAATPVRTSLLRPNSSISKQIVRRYHDYYYDNANRLGKAVYYQHVSPASGGTWTRLEDSYTVRGLDADSNYLIKYDANGNILGMATHGYKPGSPSNPVDQLRYEYYATTNKLKKVTDEVIAPDTRMGDFRDGSNGSANDYGYDRNGNLVTDQNKNINGTTGLDLTSGGAIAYNHLNLPEQITYISGDNFNKNAWFFFGE